MVDQQPVTVEVDISERLRLLMMQHKKTVADMAALAGVSKSAMEKYLAGPSSPRATAIVSLCVALEVNAHWLLFGEPDNDLLIIETAVGGVVTALLNDLKQDTKLSDEFSVEEFGSRDWRMFAWETGNARAREAVDLIVSRRKKAFEDAANGLRTSIMAPIPLRSMTDEEFRVYGQEEDR